MDLKELVQKANRLVQTEGAEIQEILQKKNSSFTATDIIHLIKAHAERIGVTEESEYKSLQEALSKRREISLNATFIALLRILRPDESPLKFLDNLESNLQSEKILQKDEPMAESEELSQADIEALLAGNTPKAEQAKAVSNSNKPQDSQLSNDDIEALLAGLTPSSTSSKESASKPNVPNNTASTKSVSENFSQEDIEALLSGENTNQAKKSSTAVEEDNLSKNDIEQLLSQAKNTEEKEQLSVDDIQALLDAQQAQDETNPLAKALDIEGKKSVTNEPILEQTAPLEIDAAPIKSETILEESNFEKTKMPQDIFSSTEALESLIKAGNDTSPKEQVTEGQPIKHEVHTIPDTSTKNLPFESFSPSNSTTNFQHIVSGKTIEASKGDEIKERLLNDTFALYVNNEGKPTLFTQCPTREEVKKAYLKALQSYPQNSLFIEKISRKEIVIVKESKEIVNLKINISFD